ncbi:MAG: helix-turn-helix domain-containing protein [Phycisphaerales bacterium]|nr:helix-turn-helix domain-containing protein [Phycisphaerales bacterium]
MPVTTNQPEILTTLRARRRELGMTFEILADRSGVSVSTLKRMLASTASDASMSDTLAVAQALGVTLSARMPSAEEFREEQAHAKARKLVRMVQGTSALESQGVDDDHIRRMIERTVRDLLNGPRRKLWAS